MKRREFLALPFLAGCNESNTATPKPPTDVEVVAITAGPHPPPPDPIPPVVGDPFIYMTPNTLPAVDGIGAFGFESGSGFREGTGTRYTYLINSHANTSSGTNVGNNTFECTWRYAAEHNVNNKIAIALRSGMSDHTDAEISWLGGNIAIVGHTCRTGTGYGTAIRSKYAMSAGRSAHVHVMGMRLYQDPAAGSPAGSSRDNLALGWSPQTPYLIVTGCELHGGIDEMLDFFNASGQVAVVETAFCSPLEGTAVSESASHNYATVAGHEVDKFTVLRCAFFHAAQRLPLSYARYTSMANCLIYNPSDNHGNNSQGTQIDKHPSDSLSQSHHANIVNCLFLNGPQGYSGNWPITSQGPLVAGSQIYVSGLRQMGYSGVTSTQSTFLGTQVGFDANQWYHSSPIAAAMPDGWGASHQYIDTITDNTAGYLTFIEQLRYAIGPQPGARAVSTVDTLLDQCRNYVNSTGSGYGAVATSQSYPTMTDFLIDPTNSTHVSSYWGGNAMPAAADFHTIGSNGRSQLESWVMDIRRVHYGT